MRTRSSYGYPEGVGESDFDDNELRRAYRRYVEDARADEFPPPMYHEWLEMMEEGDDES